MAMAKENQETVGGADELPLNDSEFEGTEHDDQSEGDDTPFVGHGARHETADLFGDGSDRDATGDDHVVSAPPSLAMWLADELRPSPSKSAPPLAPASVGHPETLAPVALPQTELSEEDLAVLPPGSRPGESRAGLRAGILLLLGAAAAVFLFSYARSPATAPQAPTEAAAQPLTDTVDRGSAPSPARANDFASPEATTTDAPAARRNAHGQWLPPAAGDETALDEEARLRGPSVGRFPDLPAEYWSELRRKELESRAERQRQLAAEALAP